MDRKLMDYLPFVVREYAEFQGIMGAEQPEFERVWDAADELLDNQFIDTAAHAGLSKWEGLLGIRPRGTDTITARRIKVKAKLNTILPYTFRALLQKIATISNGLNFDIWIENGSYLLQLYTEWDKQGQIDSLKTILKEMLPANIAVQSQNKISVDGESPLFLSHGITFCEMIALSDSGNETCSITGTAYLPIGHTYTEIVHLHDSS